MLAQIGQQVPPMSLPVPLEVPPEPLVPPELLVPPVPPELVVPPVPPVPLVPTAASRNCWFVAPLLNVHWISGVPSAVPRPFTSIACPLWRTTN